MSTRTVDNPKVVSRDEWLAARKKLLAKEKQLTRQRDATAAERRQLPWVKVEKNYVFNSTSGKKTLADLCDGRSQLIVYHFMFGPEWQEGCPSCSFNMDATDGALVHLAQRDVSFAAVSRAPISKIGAFKKRMGWKFPWVSSYETEFNYDFQASFTPEQLAKGKVEYNYDLVQFPSAEAPGVSVFYNDGPRQATRREIQQKASKEKRYEHSEQDNLDHRRQSRHRTSARHRGTQTRSEEGLRGYAKRRTAKR